MAAERTARIALVAIARADEQFLVDAFRQFKLATVTLTAEESLQRLAREKFEGCVVPLAHENAEAILKAARSAPSNKHMVLYGISDHKTAMRFSSFGLNAILPSTLDKTTVLKMVRGTYLLALHEFRRYVRVPVAIAISIRENGTVLDGLTQEVSSGGMSFTCSGVPNNKPVQATFTLPGARTITVKGTICWRREKDSFYGLRFEFADPNRQVVRGWIEDFLDSNAEASVAAKSGI